MSRQKRDQYSIVFYNETNMLKAKLTTAFFFILLLAAQAQNATVHFKHGASNLAKVAEDFGAQFKIQLAYADAELASVHVPAANYEATSVGELLNRVLAPGGFKASAQGNSWIIRRSETRPTEKPHSIMVLQGMIREDNTPIPGATLIIKQDGQKTLTAAADEKGNFSKTIVLEDGVVDVSAIGYLAARKKFTATGQQQFLNIQLQKDDAQMQDVVVTALGIRREEKALGYATTTIRGKQLTDALSGNWTDALSGKVAGLSLIRSNSGPVGTNKIILRGENNLTGDNEALIVVDGVVINQGSGRRSAIGGEAAYGTSSDNMPADYGSNINDLNPEDIETVTILKGPGAAALYGQRGANGAVIITTKSGMIRKSGLGITLVSNASAEQVNRWPALQYQYGQGLAGANYYSYGASADGASTSGTSSAYGPKFDGQQFYQFDPVTQAQGKERTPWIPYKNKIREYFNTGQTITNTVSVDGGTDKTTARFSVTNVDNKWIVPNTGYKRNSVSLSVNSKVSDKLQISSKIDYNNMWSDNLPGAGYGNQSIMYWFIFWQPSANIDWLKNYWVNGQKDRQIEFPFSSYPSNPYAVAYEYINKSNRNELTGSVSATYTLTKELTLQLRTSLDFSYEQRAQERPYDAGAKYQKGSYRTQSIFSEESSADFMLRYVKKVSHDVNLTATAGGSVLRNKYDYDETRADSLTFPGVYTMSNNAGPLVTIPLKSTYGINSFYGLLSSSYKNYLYLDLTARQDWNSVLATPLRTANAGFFYPSANLSYILSDAYHLPYWINFAKLRFSASGVGSGGTTPYLTAYNYTTAGSLYNGGLQNPDLLANPDLRPLRTITYELGTDIRLLRNRLGLDVAVYTGNTKDQILKRVVDRASGYSQVLINAGRVSNRGIEVALNGTPVKTKHFSWTASVVFDANTNRIRQLADSSVVLYTGPVGGGQIVAKVGGSMGDLYGQGYLRAPNGQVVYDNKTGFAMLDPNVKYLGNTIPKWKMGFTNDFTYKQFHLHLLFDAQYGAVAHSLTHYKLAEQGKTPNTLPGRYNGIIGNGVTADANGHYIKNNVIATDVDNYYRSHFGQDNAEGSTFRTDFIKFREARLDYTLTMGLIKKLHLTRATVGVYGRNLYIWSKWPEFDPEFGTLNGSDVIRGFEIGQFPSTRSFGANLVVGF
jgi:TonB-linked SusC/RagA family outer membrane protein